MLLCCYYAAITVCWDLRPQSVISVNSSRGGVLTLMAVEFQIQGDELEQRVIEMVADDVVQEYLVEDAVQELRPELVGHPDVTEIAAGFKLN